MHPEKFLRIGPDAHTVLSTQTVQMYLACHAMLYEYVNTRHSNTETVL